jgi:hypothetical protein
MLRKSPDFDISRGSTPREKLCPPAQGRCQSDTKSAQSMKLTKINEIMGSSESNLEQCSDSGPFDLQSMKSERN